MLEAFGLTDQGCVRANNEDYFIIDADSGIFILADGMGGAKGGEYASRLSAERLYESLVQATSFGMAADMQDAFRQANAVVREAALANSELEGMGTTLLAVRALDEHRLEVGSIGDSRAYLLAGSRLSRLTRDHTWVAEVGPRLGLDERTLQHHPMRHVLTMAVGTADSLEVVPQIVDLQVGELLLLCSDGLHGVVGEDFLQEALLSEKSLAEKAHYLVDAAKNNGGPDNITVALIQRL